MTHKWCSPISREPAISRIVAKVHACFIVRTLDPTDVPKLFATSLAPIPKASIKAITYDNITIHNEFELKLSIMTLIII